MRVSQDVCACKALATKTETELTRCLQGMRTAVRCEPRPPRPSLSVRQRGRVRGEQILKEACSPVKESATCVQRFDDSLNSAIRITYRISLRSSSLREPRYPSLRVVQRYFFFLSNMLVDKKFWFGVVKKKEEENKTNRTNASV